MRIINRPFNESTNDYEKMWEFLIEDYSYRKDQFIWTIGRLGDWKYGCWDEQKYFQSYMRKNAQLWLNNFEQLVGYVISEGCDSSFCILAKRGYEFLYTEMIAWVKANWGNRDGELNTEVHEYQDNYIKALEKEGFHKKDLIAVTRQYILSDKVKEGIYLDKDFRIEDMFENPDLRGKALLYNNAWGDNKGISQLDMLRYEYNRESPCFNPILDLSVVSGEGIHVSSCVAFVDYKNNYAEIEKICTHTDYRKKGLAEAVVRECFRRLHDQGIEYAYITGFSTEAKNLYEKLGSVKSRNWFSCILEKK